MARLKFLLRCLFSAGLLLLVVRKLNWAGLAAVLERVDLKWVAVGSLMTFGLIVSLAVRWRIFLRQQHIELPFVRILSLTWEGQFFNSVLPGSTGGDVVKIHQVCKLAPDRKAAAAASVFTDRLSALLALLVLAGAAFVMEPAPLQQIAGHGISVGWIVILGGVVLTIVSSIAWWMRRGRREPVWIGRVRRTLAATKNHFVLSCGLWWAVVLAFGIHFLSFLILFCFARSLQIGITYGQILLIMPVVLFAVLLPVTINGHGLREMLLIFYFQHLQIGLGGAAGAGVKETVVALSVLAVGNELLWSLPGGLWYFARKRSEK